MVNFALDFKDMVCFSLITTITEPQTSETKFLLLFIHYLFLEKEKHLPHVYDTKGHKRKSMILWEENWHDLITTTKKCYIFPWIFYWILICRSTVLDSTNISINNKTPGVPPLKTSLTHLPYCDDSIHYSDIDITSSLLSSHHLMIMNKNW